MNYKLLFVIFLNSITTFAEENANVFSPNKEYIIDDRDITNVKLQALAGDVSASDQLANYFLVKNDNLEDSWNWIRVAAENGSSIGVYVYAYNLSTQKHCLRAQKRALFWINKAIDLDIPLAMELKSEIQETLRLLESKETRIDDDRCVTKFW